MDPRGFLVLWAVVVALRFPGCPGQGAERSGEEAVTMARAAAVLERHADDLLALPGVVGAAVGECDGRPCIRVMVASPGPDLAKRLPRELEGVKVVVEETGEIRALDSG